MDGTYRGAALLALALIGTSAAGQPAEAAQLCGERSEILAQLEQGTPIPQAWGSPPTAA